MHQSTEITVLVTEVYPFFGEAERVFGKKAKIKIATGTSEQELAEQIVDCDVALVGHAKITEKVLEAGKRLRGIIRIGAGLDNVDLNAASKRRIPVAYNPGVNAESVAEHAVLLILALARNLARANESLKSGRWEKQKLAGLELLGRTAGVVGFGSIGSRVAEILKAFGMKIMVYDPYVDKERAETMGAMSVDLDRLLREADVVSLHSALTMETRGLIGQEQLRKMKKTAFLVNTARGALVDSTALVRALKDGVIAGAAIDVFDREPVDPHDPLLRLSNVIVTPHVGALTEDSFKRMWSTAAEKALEILSGRMPSHVVNIKELESE